jgi:hypothetical protein
MPDENPTGFGAERQLIERGLRAALLAEQELTDSPEAAEGHLEQALAELALAARDLHRIRNHTAITVIVNGRPRVVHRSQLSFCEVVQLAFDPTPVGTNIIFTVTYRNGGDPCHPDGILTEGKNVKIKEGTIFNVTATDKS